MKEKIKEEVLNKIRQKLEEMKKNNKERDLFEDQNQKEEIKESTTQIAEKPVAKEKVDSSSDGSDDCEENEKDEQTNPPEKEQPTEKIECAKPKRDLQYHVNNWKKFSKYGKPIENTCIIPSKTFYMNKKAEPLNDTSDYYSIFDCLKEHNQKGMKIEKIIDINFSYSYYNFNYLKRKNKEELYSVEYIKIPLIPKEIPSRKELNRIYDILNKNISKKQYILIHCTNGVNRTGYVVTYFLCKRYNYSVDKALEIFNKARGHRFKNRKLIADLRQKFPENK